MKKIILLTSILVSAKIQAQTISAKIVDNDLSVMKNLQIRPNVAFTIPIIGELGDGNPISLNLDAQYWLLKIVDVRASFLYGFIKGGSIGGTFHLMDKEQATKQKFVVGRSSNGRTTTTTYFKMKANSRNIFGPCADVTFGGIQDFGAIVRADIGFDYQSFSKAWAETEDSRFKSSRNGWFSFKLLGAIASMNYKGVGPTKRVLGIGGLASLGAIVRPWKTICLSTGIQAGALKLQGLDEVDKKDALKPIVSFNLGLSINI
jgi:hypothetical protein